MRKLRLGQGKYLVQFMQLVSSNARLQLSSSASASSGYNSRRKVLIGPLRSRQPLRTTFFPADVKQQIFQRHSCVGPSAICSLMC